MSVPYYPQTVITPNLGLSLIGQDEVIAENFVIIDAAVGGGSSVSSFTGDGTLLNNSLSTGAVIATTPNRTPNTVYAGPVSGASAPGSMRALVGADLPAGITTSTMIVSGAVTSGNPSFLSAGSGATINVDGSTTPLVYYINGTRQVINSLLTITAITPVADALVFVLAAVDTVNANPVSADLFLTANLVFCSYSTPTASGLTTTNNPAYWFDLSTNTTKKAVSAGTGWVIVPSMIVLGVAVVSSTPVVRAVLCEPFQLTNYQRVIMFGDASTQQGLASATLGIVTSNTALVDGIRYIGCAALSGAVLAVSTTPNLNGGGSVVYSQFPVIITNNASWGQPGASGAAGGAGTAAATGSVGGTGNAGGQGGGGGGGVANTGGAGGPQNVPTRLTALTNAGGAGGTAGNVGSNSGASANTTLLIASNNLPSVYYFYKGAGGGGGAGVVGSTGGTGGTGGGVHILIAPAIFIDAGCTFTSAGAVGSNGGGTQSAGGGGGGGGLAIVAGGYVINNGTLTAAGGLGGTAVGASVGNGGNGQAGFTKVFKLL